MDAARRPRPFSTTSGFLLAATAWPWLAMASAFGGPADAPAWCMALTLFCTVVFLAAGLAIVRRPRAGRVLASGALVGSWGIFLPVLVVSPLRTLASLLLLGSFLAQLWDVLAPLAGWGHPRRSLPAQRARGAALAALLAWLLHLVFAESSGQFLMAATGLSLGISTGLGLGWVWANRGERAWKPWLLGGVLLLGGGLAILLRDGAGAVGIGAALAAVQLALVADRGRPAPLVASSWWEPVLGHPERLFVGAFAGLCAIGTVLLALPASASAEHGVGWLDALFTSVSAVCVTGLIVLDTPTDFSRFGQWVILVLIQLGGLGIMTFSTVALWALGRRISLRHEGAVAQLLSQRDHGRIFESARRVLGLTVVAEAVGMLLLLIAFVGAGEALWPAAWRAVFTAVSAFCNAGFALQSDSLVGFQQDPLVLHTVATLIIAGGLSPLAIFAIPSLLRRGRGPASVQAQLALAAAAFLLLAGALFYLALEWELSLAGLPLADKLHNAWFQSATLRTAGFNSVDIGAAAPATLTLMMLFMIIGGSPGGTAGGIKTTTAAILLLSVLQVVRGRSQLVLFGRALAEPARQRAAVVFTLAMLGLVAGVIAIELTQAIAPGPAIFEVVSALGTVGLSLGATTSLDGIGKLVIVACMFVGRVGGLTLLMFLSQRGDAPGSRRPEVQIDVG